MTGVLADPLPHRSEVHGHGQAQSPAERPPTLRQCEAVGGGVQVRPTTRQAPPWVRNHNGSGRDDAQQVGLRGPDPAPDARAHGDGPLCH